MPQFVLSEGVHYVGYITGPSSLLLGLRFSDTPLQSVSLVMQSSYLTSTTLPAEEVLRAVTAGVDRSSLGKKIEKVVVAGQDSASASLYEHAAFLLAEAIARGEPFQPAKIQAPNQLLRATEQGKREE